MKAKQEEVGAEQKKVRKNKEKFDEMVWDIVKRREDEGGLVQVSRQPTTTATSSSNTPAPSYRASSIPRRYLILPAAIVRGSGSNSKTSTET